MNKAVETLLNNEYFIHISKDNKNFIRDFDKEMQKSGFEIENKMLEGAFWGKIINYCKSNVKSRKIITRISFIENNNISIRLFFDEKNIKKNMKYIENTPFHIKLPFQTAQNILMTVILWDVRKNICNVNNIVW